MTDGEKNDTSLNGSRNAVMWFSSIILIDSFLGVEFRKFNDALSGVNDKSVAAVFLFILAYFTYRYFVYFRITKTHQNAVDISDLKEERFIAVAERRTKRKLALKYGVSPEKITLENWQWEVNVKNLDVRRTLYEGHGQLRLDTHVEERFLQDHGKELILNSALLFQKFHAINVFLRPTFLNYYLPFALSAIALIVLVCKLLFVSGVKELKPLLF